MGARPTGRPRGTRVYPQRAWDTVLDRLKEGQTLTKACAGEGLPAPSTVVERTKTDAAFAEEYARSRELGYLLLADELLDIADDTSGDVKPGADGKPYVDLMHIQRARLRVDTRKWLLAKCLPKIYGDRPAAAPPPVPDFAAMLRREAAAYQLFDDEPGPNGAAPAAEER